MMPRKKPRPVLGKLDDALMKNLRRSRALIAKELPDLIEKDKRLCDAMQERSTSGALRRAIHSSRILLPDLADRAQTDMDALDAFLTWEESQTSDIIDRLTEILKLRLQAVGSKPKPRPSKAGWALLAMPWFGGLARRGLC
jgi:hypothetical protein